MQLLVCLAVAYPWEGGKRREQLLSAPRRNV